MHIKLSHVRLKFNQSSLYITFSILLVFVVVSQFKSIPGPPYGGDLYFHNGIAEAIFHSTFPFKDPINYEGYAFYPWLYHLIVSLLGWIFGDVMRVTVYAMPFVILTSSMVVLYHLLSEISSKIITPLVFLLPLAFSFPDPHPHTLLFLVCIPLFYYSLVRYLKNASVKNGALLGISWAISGLTHVLGIFGIGAIMLANVVWDVIEMRNVQTAVKRWILPFMVAILISSLYWGPLVIQYYAKTPNPYQSLVWAHYTLVNFTADIATFFIFGSWKVVLSLLALGGLYVIVKYKPQPISRIIFSSIAGLYILGVFFILVGDPLIAVKTTLYFPTLTILLISESLSYFALNVSNSSRALIAISIILIALSGNTILGFMSNPWTQNGVREFPFLELREWIFTNTNNDDVILSNYESSFMLFSISGRKTVIFRRTHASPFVDYNNRSAEIMVALWGGNITNSLKILKSYRVKYVYIDEISSKDPLWVPISYREYLESNGVPCHVERVRYDPADPRSVKIEACVVEFNVSKIAPYLEQVFQKGTSKMFRVVYPES